MRRDVDIFCACAVSSAPQIIVSNCLAKVSERIARRVQLRRCNVGPAIVNNPSLYGLAELRSG